MARPVYNPSNANSIASADIEKAAELGALYLWISVVAGLVCWLLLGYAVVNLAFGP